jgi:hypothetical protein
MARTKSNDTTSWCSLLEMAPTDTPVSERQQPAAGSDYVRCCPSDRRQHRTARTLRLCDLRGYDGQLGEDVI